MKSDVFMLNSDAGRMAAARYATEDFAHSINLEQHEALQLELLTEETLGMVKALVDDFYGQLWYENEGKTSTASCGTKTRASAVRFTCKPRQT